MGQLDNDPIPPYAVTMWASDTDIYVALPMKDGGVPYITKYSLTEAGLAKALRVLQARRYEAKPATMAQPANYTLPPKQPMVKLSKKQEQLHSETTQEQRDNAKRLIERLGLKK